MHIPRSRGRGLESGKITLVQTPYKEETHRGPAPSVPGPEMLDTIVPGLQEMGRQVLPTLPSLSQEGKLLGMGAPGLGLPLLVG
jgi:hypothetical protein